MSDASARVWALVAVVIAFGCAQTRTSAPDDHVAVDASMDVVRDADASGDLGGGADARIDEPVDAPSPDALDDDHSEPPGELPAPTDAAVAEDDAPRVGTGTDFSCVQSTTGRVSCWGTPTILGRAPGTPGREHVPRPSAVVDGSGVPLELRQLVAAEWSACGVRPSGGVVCWGGQGGAGGVARDVPGFTDVRHLAMGVDSYVCAVRGDGAVVCGSGVTAAIRSAIQIEGLRDATRVAAGRGFACAIRRDGTLWCWGFNDYGQLGDGTRRARASPMQVAELTDVVEVVAGAVHVCARRRDGEVRCWGRGTYGVLGLGHQTDATRPVVVPEWFGATRLSANASNTCAVVGGEVRCSGANRHHHIGPGHVLSHMTPERVGTLTGAVDVDVGVAHTCALVRDTRGALEVRCWGRDNMGQLGLGHEAQASPRPVTNLTDAVALAVGSTHACAVRRAGQVVCWGDDAAYELLGDGAPFASVTPDPREAPALVTGLTTATAVTAGVYFTCAVLRDATVSCWGSSRHGELGDGMNISRNVPAPVTDLTGVAEVVAGGMHACARLASGRVRCWGLNMDGQVTGRPGADVMAPSEVVGVVDAAQLSLGASHSCARLHGGRVVCWGRGAMGELGGDRPTNGIVEVTDGARSTPGAPVALADVTRLSCAAGSTCAALRSSGEVVAWGADVGPRAVSWGAIAGWQAQRFFRGTCQLLGGALHFGGSNEWGTAGNGMPYVATYEGLRPDTARSASRVVGGATYTTFGHADRNVCALRSDDRVDCWGAVGHGFLNVTGLDHLVRSPPAVGFTLP